MKAFSPLPLIGHYGGLTIKGLCLAHLIDPAHFIEPKVKNTSSVAVTDQILCMLHIKYVSHNELLRVDWWEFFSIQFFFPFLLLFVTSVQQCKFHDHVKREKKHL